MYDILYEEYFKILRCNSRIMFLEIGLGCGYDPEGASVHMWSEYFQNEAELHFADVDSGCVDRFRGNKKYPSPKFHFHVVDQSNLASLESLAKITGGNFDVIIDDGGHVDSHSS